MSFDKPAVAVLPAPIFVGGLMRSGTSLTRVLLSQHRDLFGTFETHWFSEPVRTGWRDTSSSRMQLLLQLLPLEDSEYETVSAAAREEPERPFIDVAMSYCTTRAGKSRWVEKTPDNIRHWGLIKTHWPDGFLIHVTREYKDAYASWKTKRGASLDEFLNAVRGAYDEIGPLLGSNVDRYLEIDYNALVNDTEAEMRRILDGVDATWDENCASLNLGKTVSERCKIRDVLGRESPTAKSLIRPINDEGVGQWRHLISNEEASRIETELADLYDVFGDRWPS